jgi:hypothetical protein
MPSRHYTREAGGDVLDPMGRWIRGFMLLLTASPPRNRECVLHHLERICEGNCEGRAKEKRLGGGGLIDQAAASMKGVRGR